MSRSARTVRAYGSDWADFTAWCAACGARPLPAEPATVAAYVDDRARRRRVATVQRRVAAIGARHLDAGREAPTRAPVVTAALARAHWAQRNDTRVTEPIGVEELRAMSEACPSTTSGARDRALLLVGYGAGLRPGELTALTVGDVRLVPAGITVRVPRGRVTVPFGSDEHLCAVRAWKRWRRVGAGGEGPAFRGVDRHGRVGRGPLGQQAVTRIVRRAAARAGLDGNRWSGLSLRRGTVLAAAEHGVSEHGIMSQTGHRSRRLVRRYMAERP